jgi:hypothetical protein
MAAAGVHGFPAVLTSFVGRAGAVREVAGLLEECRLVTVTGTGGVGKTRLAVQVARRAAGRFADGAWLAELAPVRDPAQVAPVVAAVLGVREQPGVPAEEALTRVLARQQQPRSKPRRQGWESSAPGNGSWSPWSPRAGPMPRSPPSCTSASAPSAPTWTGSGTRPAAAAAPTLPAWP